MGCLNLSCKDNSLEVGKLENITFKMRMSRIEHKDNIKKGCREMEKMSVVKKRRKKYLSEETYSEEGFPLLIFHHLH